MEDVYLPVRYLSVVFYWGLLKVLELLFFVMLSSA